MKTSKKPTSKIFKLIAVIFAIIAVVCVAAIVWLNSSYYKCTDNEALNNTALSKVSSFDDHILIDGPGDQEVFVFYPGAMCESDSYCATLKPVADSGIDIIIAKPMFHFQLLQVGQINDFKSKYHYSKWSIGGHSLGGVCASKFCASNPGICDKCVFVASYASDNLSDAVSGSLLLTASNDKVLNWEEYNKALANLPANKKEYSIEGGNHAQFGNYGEQKSDGEATISPNQQQTIASSQIIKFLKS